MSIPSEKFSRFLSVDYEDLQCTDVLDDTTCDTEMQAYVWKTADQDFLTTLNSVSITANPFYLECRQTFITAEMRCMLMDWIFEICSDFFLKRETCFKAISYVDMFLSVASPVRKESFQLLGLTACILACKMEEICYPKVTDFIKAAGNIYTVLQVREMERDLLCALQWKTVQPNAMTVLEWLTSQWDQFILSNFLNQSMLLKAIPIVIINNAVESHKKYRDITQLVDNCMLDISILHFTPKIIAACACYLVLFKYLKRENFISLAGPDLFECTEEKSVSDFMALYLIFLTGALEICGYEELYDCMLFMNKYLEVGTSYKQPNVCRSGFRPEVHTVEFLAYQTHNPLCIQATLAALHHAN